MNEFKDAIDLALDGMIASAEELAVDAGKRQAANLKQAAWIGKQLLQDRLDGVLKSSEFEAALAELESALNLALAMEVWNSRRAAIQALKDIVMDLLPSIVSIAI